MQAADKVCGRQASVSGRAHTEMLDCLQFSSHGVGLQRSVRCVGNAATRTATRIMSAAVQDSDTNKPRRYYYVIAKDRARGGGTPVGKARERRRQSSAPWRPGGRPGPSKPVRPRWPSVPQACGTERQRIRGGIRAPWRAHSPHPRRRPRPRRSVSRVWDAQRLKQQVHLQMEK